MFSCLTLFNLLNAGNNYCITTFVPPCRLHEIDNNNNNIALLIVWFVLQRKKWSTWRWLIARAETCSWMKQCKDNLLLTNINQVLFDYILPVFFIILTFFLQNIPSSVRRLKPASFNRRTYSYNLPNSTASHTKNSNLYLYHCEQVKYRNR